MKINIRVIILSTFVVVLIGLMIVRSCSRPPKKGETVYMEHCSSCHGINGEGFRNLIPPMNDSVFLDTHSDEFACIVAYGMQRPITINGVKYEQPMAGIEKLNNIEIANVANYVYERWSNPNKKFTAKEVENSMANCE